jgi:hypothetical protein
MPKGHAGYSLTPGGRSDSLAAVTAAQAKNTSTSGFVSRRSCTRLERGYDGDAIRTRFAPRRCPLHGAATSWKLWQTNFFRFDDKTC